MCHEGGKARGDGDEAYTHHAVFVAPPRPNPAGIERIIDRGFGPSGPEEQTDV